MTPTHRNFRYFTYVQPFLKIPIVRTYGAPILTILVLTIFLLFAIKPTVETILVLQKKLDDAKVVAAKVSQKSQDLSNAKKNYQSLDPTIRQKIQVAIPEKVEIRTITQTLESIAQSNNASISALQFEPLSIEESSKSSTLQEIIFTYNLEGRYDNLVNIISSIQTNTRLMTIDSLIMNKLEENPNLLMSVSAKAYYLK